MLRGFGKYLNTSRYSYVLNHHAVYSGVVKLTDEPCYGVTVIFVVHFVKTRGFSTLFSSCEQPIETLTCYVTLPKVASFV